MSYKLFFRVFICVYCRYAVNQFLLRNHNLYEVKNFHIAYNTIEWANGADFAPEYLIAC